MTGPEHYRQAEALLSRDDPERIAAAQVHATLALAAATYTQAYIGVGETPEWMDDAWGMMPTRPVSTS